MTIQEISEAACEIIGYAGDGKSWAMEAIEHAEHGDFAQAKKEMEHAEESIIKAHEKHTELLALEAEDPDSIRVTMFLLHASNHLSAAEIVRDLGERMICFYEKNREPEQTKRSLA